MYGLSMWLVHGRYVSCLWASLPWIPKFGQLLDAFGLEMEFLAFFSKKKLNVSKLDLLDQLDWA